MPCTIRIHNKFLCGVRDASLRIWRGIAEGVEALLRLFRERIKRIKSLSVDHRANADANVIKRQSPPNISMETNRVLARLTYAERHAPHEDSEELSG